MSNSLEFPTVMVLLEEPTALKVVCQQSSKDHHQFTILLITREAEQQKHGARVTVAGINIRLYRPPTRSGRSVLFSTIEDEFGFVQVVCVGDALEACTPVFLLSPVVIVRGVIERRGTGVSLRVERVKPLHLSVGFENRCHIENELRSDENKDRRNPAYGLANSNVSKQEVK